MKVVLVVAALLVGLILIGMVGNLVNGKSALHDNSSPKPSAEPVALTIGGKAYSERAIRSTH